MHVHPSSPNSSISEENAATKIQANFRGYRVRKQIKDTSVVVSASSAAANAAVSGGCCSGQQSTDGNHMLTSAGVGKRGALMSDERDQSATKIQAGIRGFLVRKKQKMASDAATKIQANFRGFKTRQDLKRMND